MKSKFMFLLLSIIMVMVYFPAITYAADGVTSGCQHSWSYAYTESYASCGSSGIDVYECDNCSATERRTVAATGNHDWDEWEVVKSATVFRKGISERTCLDCGKSQTKKVSKLRAFAKFGKKNYKVKARKTIKLKNRLSMGKGDKVVKWKSSNPSIATVTSKGVVKARKSGTVTITAKLKSGKKATCKVKVKKVATRSKKSSSSSSGGTVYWVPSGSVYHSTKSCSTLSRSKTIYSGTLSECPKSRPCKVCH